MIEVSNLAVTFRNGGRPVHAVRGVSFSVAEGETFGIVGESGSGKSTVLKAVAGLCATAGPSLTINGAAMGAKRSKAERRLMQFVFQDPYGSLHPRQTVDDMLREPLLIHGVTGVDAKVAEALADVGLEPQHRFRFPHQLSGGQRQRMAIARALILRPRILLLDEPTSALDVSIQAEILNLLSRLRRGYQLTSILVSHDLAVVAHLCSRIAIMQQGLLVEMLDVESLRRGQAKEAYTLELIAASRGYARAGQVTGSLLPAGKGSDMAGLARAVAVESRPGPSQGSGRD
ncbi:MAG: ABC transporter ATP-binding protein [Rhizobiales bacterium]|nr:ABC transporter ATP-binding protein [Hyphomicrobiales bacterium]MBI3672318.1 ABC transporter ATP-binding protein [Hyphomicrobiales bacterium]